MRINKLDFILYIKNNNLSWILYLIALLMILIPAFIVIITDVPFSSTYSRIFIGAAMFLVIVGKLLSLAKKEKGDKNISIDIAIIIGIATAFILHVLK